MQNVLTRQKLLLFFSQLGQRAKSKGACFLTGGSSAVLLGWRETTLKEVR